MKHLLLLLFFTTLPLAIDAQAVFLNYHMVPPLFFVGDLVELHINYESRTPLGLRVPETLPESEWFEIRDIRIRQKGSHYTVIVDFVPFSPNTHSLPLIDLGELQIQDMKIPTHSILNGSHPDARHLRAQSVLPGTRLGLTLLLSLLAMAPFIVYGFLRFVWKWIKKSKEILRIRRPVRQMRRLLKKLKVSTDSQTTLLWFADLTDGLRNYLSEKTGYDCRSATTAEISARPEFKDSVKKNLLDVLKYGDMVKFAGYQTDKNEMLQSLVTVESAVSEWEK